MEFRPIPDYAVDCNTNRNPGTTYGDARHVKSRIASTLRHFNSWSRIKIFKRKDNRYVQFLDNTSIELILNKHGGDMESAKKEIHRIIDEA